MNEPSSEPKLPQFGQESIDRRALSRAHQWRLAAVGAAVVVLTLLGFWLGGRLFEQRGAPPSEPPPPPGTFRATAQQIKTLTIEAVRLHGFVSEEFTEGKIAVNGDHTTPLYSPYSGRVTRVIAGLGDTVKKGAPLATLEASEYVQAQNDLATAVAQRKLARINEGRKHALYDAKGGSLQDWQQAQADLTAAETAVHSVRNRLKILGRSESQIDQLEEAQSIDSDGDDQRAHRRV
jgi:cobalt-zinc-cadmium efflux system membrane fusion protein